MNVIQVVDEGLKVLTTHSEGWGVRRGETRAETHDHGYGGQEGLPWIKAGHAIGRVLKCCNQHRTLDRALDCAWGLRNECDCFAESRGERSWRAIVQPNGGKPRIATNMLFHSKDFIQ